MRKIMALLLIILFTFPSCEKDDICDPNTSTTPRLIISFYSAIKPSDLKPFSSLRIVGDGMTNAEGIQFNNTSKIEVPLQTTQDITKYKFILNFGNTNTETVYTDTLQFNYTGENIYVSRACGYKRIFTLNTKPGTMQNAFVLNDDPTKVRGNWITYIIVKNYNVANENETHINIYY